LPTATAENGIGAQMACAQDGCCACPPSPCFGAGGCFVDCDNGGGGAGTPEPTPPPVPTQPGGGDPTPPPGEGTPPPGGTPAPAPTAPPGLNPGTGFYRTACDAYTTECRPNGSVLTWWCYTGGTCYVVSHRCAAPGECTPVTPTPRPTQNPNPDPEWPCDTPPEVSGGVIVQPCPRWPGWDLRVEVWIPPADVLRNPWPRSLVGLPTQFWFRGGADVEAFSTNVALPCTVDYGATYVIADNNLPSCPAPVGEAGEGTRVNYQLGVAWRRWKATTGPIFGFQPAQEVEWHIPDRAWNGGTRYAAGYYVAHTFETSSWGLEANGPAWNSTCQDRDCSCNERVAGWSAEAYQVGVTTWWYPQYTFRYDEMYCSRRERTPCYCFPHEPVWEPSRQSCGTQPGCTGWYGSVDECTELKWRRITEPWATYDLTKLGYQSIIPWYLVRQAGATTSGQQCGDYGPTGGSVPVPVIEVQPVAP